MAIETHHFDPQYAPKQRLAAPALPPYVPSWERETEADRAARAELSARRAAMEAWLEASGPWRGTFVARVERLSAMLGAPQRAWSESYPSGGGSDYAQWLGVGLSVRLETGGYDAITGAAFTRAPRVSTVRP